MKGSLSLIENVLTRTPQNDGTGLISFATGKLDNLIFSDEDFLD